MTEFRMDREKDGNHRVSSWKALALVVCLAAGWEVPVMLVLENSRLENLLLKTAFNAGSLSVVLIVTAYFFIVRPLVRLSTAFHDNEHRLYSYARTASDWFWSMGPNLRFAHLSETFAITTGLDSALLIGKMWEESGLMAVNRAALDSHLVRLESHSPFRNAELALREASGDVLWLSITGQPLFGRGAFSGLCRYR
ncbi:MAG: nwsA [Rhodospirillaceae bacterium]|nr:MAG: nwsA [Rhodospirillaceae bacterium]